MWRRVTGVRAVNPSSSTLTALVASAFVICALAEADSGSLFVEVTDALDRGRPGFVELVPLGTPGAATQRFELENGKTLASCPAGAYRAYTYAYDYDLPIMIDCRDVTIETTGMVSIVCEVVEGTLIENSQVKGRFDGAPLRTFDQDFDLVLDKVEIAMGTDPLDPSSFPGAEPALFESPVLDKKPGWYKGDLHVRSIHGGGSESVAELVKRAEKSGLDFIAITDRNTMAACLDAGFTSNKVVLIPAMEWGSDERGVALIYGPRTFPRVPVNAKEAQGVCQRVQAQGGVFAIAHPCFPTAPWQWGLSYVNAIEVWCRDWRAVPPMSLQNLVSEYGRRVNGKLVYSISLAANAAELSANGQAAMFWDYETTRGLKASPIAGSLSSSPRVPMGQPITYVYALEKSARGILHGLRLGRTSVSVNDKGPYIEILADAQASRGPIREPVPDAKGNLKQAVKLGKTDVGAGGVVPTGLYVDLVVLVRNAKGAKVEILRNGWPIVTKKIDTDKGQLIKTTDKPTAYTVYRARVIRAPQEKGFGPVDVLAMSAPIYAQNVVPIDAQKENPFDIWIKIENRSLPPARVSEIVEEGNRTRVRFEEGGPVQPVRPDEFQPPPDAQVKTLTPKQF